jgi:hypothetical protein
MVRIVRKEFAVHDAVTEVAADWKSVANNSPLRFAVEAQDFAKIMDQAGQYKPVFMSILANGFGGLQQVLKLIEINIRV